MNDKSHYYIKTLKDGEKRFVKHIPMSLYNKGAYIFQNNVIPEFNGELRINKIESLTENYKESNVTVNYEYIDESTYSVDETVASIFGENIAKLHNYSFTHDNQLHVKSKSDKYDNMDTWDTVSNVDIDFLSFRHEIFHKTARIFQGHPKIVLHRDVRLHNILFDGELFHLIDFDYTARDFVGIELGGFICDLVDKYNNNVLYSFLENYISTNKFIGKDACLNVLDSFILYLCTNTFPFYLEDNFTTEQYNDYVSQRTRRLKLIIERRDEINDIILKIYGKIQK